MTSKVRVAVSPWELVAVTVTVATPSSPSSLGIRTKSPPSTTADNTVESLDPAA